jgi:AraC-like DNA-binding protein
MIDVDRSPASAFGLAEELPAGEGSWHAHGKHQLLYASEGSLRLEIERQAWLLPPQRAAWIRGQVPHRVSCERPASLRTVYFDPLRCEGPEGDCRVFAVGTLARELMVHCMRWGPKAPLEPIGEHFFCALLALCEECWATPLPFHLPRAKTPELERAMGFALSHLKEGNGLEQLARMVGVSGKTLARRFQAECQMSWRQFLLTARMIRATELLANPQARVAQTAFAVGFESPSAFGRAFSSFVGETPEAYRQRCRSLSD